MSSIVVTNILKNPAKYGMKKLINCLKNTTAAPDRQTRIEIKKNTNISSK